MNRTKSVLIILMICFLCRSLNKKILVESWHFGDDADFHKLSDEELIKLERKPGSLSSLPQINAPAPPKHPNLKGSPGFSPAMGPNDAEVKQ